MEAPYTNKVYSNRDKRYVLEKLGRLSSTEHEEIFKIVCKNNVPYTQNKNGLFINLSLVDDDVVETIDKFVDFCIKNKLELDEYDKRITECKMNNNYDKIMSRTTDDITSIVGDAPRSLGDVIHGISQEDNWQQILQDERVNDKVASLASMLEDNTEKSNKKKGSMKYVNAKKKYSRRFAAEKKDIDMNNTLMPDPYPIHRTIAT